jgi:hypothetical protein
MIDHLYDFQQSDFCRSEWFPFKAAIEILKDKI